MSGAPGENGGGSCPYSQPETSVDTNVCPASIAISGSPTSITLNDPGAFPTYKTGLGISAHMSAIPNNVNWNGTLVSESVEQSINSCPASWNVCSGSDTWSLGEDGGSQFGHVFPAAGDEFWDFHEYIASFDKLTQAGLGGCAATCTQTYYCGGLPLSTYTINFGFTKGTIQGQSVTIVNVTKQ
jgi:hypothetical protein